MKLKLIPLDKYILAVDEAAEVKEGDFIWDFSNHGYWRCVAKGNIHPNCSKVLAHLPLTEKISGLLELPEMDNSEQLGEEYASILFRYESGGDVVRQSCKQDFIAGYKARGGYSEAQIKEAIDFGVCVEFKTSKEYFDHRNEFLTSLKPKYFECEMQFGNGGYSNSPTNRPPLEPKIENGKLKGKYLSE